MLVNTKFFKGVDSAEKLKLRREFLIAREEELGRKVIEPEKLMIWEQGMDTGYRYAYPLRGSLGIIGHALCHGKKGSYDSVAVLLTDGSLERVNPVGVCEKDFCITGLLNWCRRSDGKYDVMCGRRHRFVADYVRVDSLLFNGVMLSFSVEGKLLFGLSWPCFGGVTVLCRNFVQLRDYIGQVGLYLMDSDELTFEGFIFFCKKVYKESLTVCQAEFDRIGVDPSETFFKEDCEPCPAEDIECAIETGFDFENGHMIEEKEEECDCETV